MKRTLLISLLRFIVTISIACLLMLLLLRLWPNTQNSGNSIAKELEWIVISGGRSLFLIVLALLFSIGFTAFSLLFSTRFRQPRFIGLGIKTCFYIFSTIPTIFTGYFVLAFFDKKLGIDLQLLGDDAGRWQYYLIPALVLGVGDGFLNELIQHAEAEVDAIRRENYVRMVKAIGAKMWPYIKNDLIVHSSRVLFSRITALLSGTVVVELVFGIPGLGWLAFNAAENRYSLRLVLILLCIVIVVSFLNLIYQVMIVILDPRLR